MRRANLVTGFVATVAMLVVSAMALKNKRDLREIAHQRTMESEIATAQRSIATHGQAAIVVFGDSIVVNAPLPPSVCGISFVNAGVSGARASTIIPLLETIIALHIQPKRIVIAVGVNNANIDYWNEETFVATYETLLRVASSIAPTVVATVAPVDTHEIVGKVINPDARDIINGLIIAMAEKFSLPTIRLDNITLNTVDGVHLGPSDYKDWISQVVGAISKC
jgi:hypothetical protein